MGLECKASIKVHSAVHNLHHEQYLQRRRPQLLPFIKRRPRDFEHRLKRLLQQFLIPAAIAATACLMPTKCNRAHSHISFCSAARALMAIDHKA